MKKNNLTALTAVFALLSLGSLFLYFLALSDISNDYVSTKVLENHSDLDPATLPDWTSTTGEWFIVRIGYGIMLAFHILFFVNLLRREMQKIAKNEPA